MSRSGSIALLLATALSIAVVEPAAAARRRPPSPWNEDPSIVPREDLLAEKARVSAAGTRPRPTGRAPSAPEETVQWDAIRRLIDTSPADPTGAKGLNHVVTAVNVHYAVWMPNGTAVVGPSTLSSLFTGLIPSGTRLFDPKVVYDARRGRFFIVVAGLTSEPFASHVLVASFSDAEATTPRLWCKRRLPGDAVPGDGNLIADYPGVGFDDSRLYVATNQFTPRERFRYAQVLAIERSDLGSGCTGTPDFRKFYDLREPSGRRAFTVQPAVTVGTGPAPAGWGLSFDWRCFPCRGSGLTVWRWSRQGGRLVQRSTSMNVGTARIAPLGRQRGGGGLDARWDTGDLRLVTAFFDTDRRRLYGAHAVAKNLGRTSPNESVVRWYEVRAADRLRRSTVSRKGIVGAPDTDSAWPAIATNARGRVFLSYSRAAPDEFLSAWAATVARQGTASQALLLRRGEARYEATSPFGSSGIERWGDYNAITRDPTGAQLQMWSVNQYAKNDGDASNGLRSELWQQVVNALHA